MGARSAFVAAARQHAMEANWRGCARSLLRWRSAIRRGEAARRMAGSAACGPPREPQRNCCTRHGSGSIAVRGAGVVVDAKPAGRHLAVEGIRRLR